MQALFDTVASATSSMIWGTTAEEDSSLGDAPTNSTVVSSTSTSRVVNPSVPYVNKPRIFATSTATSAALHSYGIDASSSSPASQPNYYNNTRRLKVLIRGARRTGKSTLFRKLQGLPAVEPAVAPAAASAATYRTRSGRLRTSAPPTPPPQQQASFSSSSPQQLPYTPTTAIDVMRFSWQRNNICADFDVWDVVDHGTPMPLAQSSGHSLIGARSINARITSTTAAAAANGEGITARAIARSAPKDLPMLPVDATTIDVYKGGGECDLVIFLYDRSRRETFEYVRRAVRDVPRNVPIIIGSNFSDKLRDVRPTPLNGDDGEASTGGRRGRGSKPAKRGDGAADAAADGALKTTHNAGRSDAVADDADALSNFLDGSPVKNAAPTEGFSAADAAAIGGVSFEEEQALIASIPNAISNFTRDAMGPAVEALRRRHASECVRSEGDSDDDDDEDDGGHATRREQAATNPKGLSVPPLLISFCLPCGYGMRPLHAALEAVVAFHRAKELEAQSRICYGLAEKALGDAVREEEEQTFKTYTALLKAMDRQNGTRESAMIPVNSNSGRHHHQHGNDSGRAVEGGSRGKGVGAAGVGTRAASDSSSSSCESSSSSSDGEARRRKAKRKKAATASGTAATMVADASAAPPQSAASMSSPTGNKFGTPPQGFQATRRGDTVELDTRFAAVIPSTVRSAAAAAAAGPNATASSSARSGYGFGRGGGSGPNTNTAAKAPPPKTTAMGIDDFLADVVDDDDEDEDEGSEGTPTSSNAPSTFLAAMATRRSVNAADDSAARRARLEQRRAEAAAAELAAEMKNRNPLLLQKSAMVGAAASIITSAGSGTSTSAAAAADALAMVEHFKRQLEEAKIGGDDADESSEDDDSSEGGEDATTQQRGHTKKGSERAASSSRRVDPVAAAMGDYHQDASARRHSNRQRKEERTKDDGHSSHHNKEKKSKSDKKEKKAKKEKHSKKEKKSSKQPKPAAPSSSPEASSSDPDEEERVSYHQRPQTQKSSHAVAEGYDDIGDGDDDTVSSGGGSGSYNHRRRNDGRNYDSNAATMSVHGVAASSYQKGGGGGAKPASRQHANTIESRYAGMGPSGIPVSTSSGAGGASASAIGGGRGVTSLSSADGPNRMVYSPPSEGKGLLSR